MEQLGQIVSSDSNFFTNFGSTENISDVSHKMINQAEISQENSAINNIIKQKIFAENGAPYILLNTDLCERPIKLYIDTGVSVSIIADDVIRNDIIKKNEILNIFGIADEEASIKTQGIVHNIFSMGNTLLKTKLHVVDRKYVGPGDGYLGFDFLAPYRVNIDLNEMFVTINLKNSMITNQNENDELNSKTQKEHSNEEIEKNFLNFLAQTYEFEPKNIKCLQEKRILRKFCANNNSKNANTFSQKECEKLNLSQETSSPKALKKGGIINKFSCKNCYAKNNSNNSHIQSLPNSKILDMEQYRNSLSHSKIPENASCKEQTYESLPCSPSTEKQDFGTISQFGTPQFNKIDKNSASNTSNVQYFKDYG